MGPTQPCRRVWHPIDINAPQRAREEHDGVAEHRSFCLVPIYIAATHYRSGSGVSPILELVSGARNDTALRCR
jgi:hypothetical protein